MKNCTSKFKVTKFLFVIVGVLFPLNLYAYKYSSNKKVDPFVPFALSKSSEPQGQSRLQQSDLSQLTLVGTLIGSEITALILTPDPVEGIVVQVGDRLGRLGGRVVSISRTKVVVREPVSENGSKKFKDFVMELPRAVNNPRPGEPGTVGLPNQNNAVAPARDYLKSSSQFGQAIPDPKKVSSVPGSNANIAPPPIGSSRQPLQPTDQPIPQPNSVIAPVTAPAINNFTIGREPIRPPG